MPARRSKSGLYIDFTQGPPPPVVEPDTALPIAHLQTTTSDPSTPDNERRNHTPLKRKRSSSIPNSMKLQNYVSSSKFQVQDRSPFRSRSTTYPIQHEVKVNIVPEIHRARKPPEITTDGEALTMKERMKILFLKSDLHGLPDWWEANSVPLKICWSVILILALTMLIIELIYVVNDFRDNPILTTYGLVTDSGGIEFPDVYLCPSNPIHRATKDMIEMADGWEEEYVKGLLRAHTNQSGLSGLLARKTAISESLSRFMPLPQMPGPAPFPGPEPPTTTTEAPPPKDAHEYFMRAGYPTNVFLKECAFNSMSIDCELLADPVFDPDYGKCFLLKTGMLHQNVAGVGLSLVISLDYDDAYPEARVDSPLFDGVIMKIAKKFDIGQSQYSLLSPGTVTRTTLELTKMNLIERERSKGSQSCIDKEDGQKLLQVLEGDYSVGLCQSDCIRQVVVTHCGCHMPIDKRFLKKPSLEYCKPTRLIECAYPKIYDHPDFIRDCAKKCSSPCTVWQYRSDTSSAVFPSYKLRKAFPPPPFDVSYHDVYQNYDSNDYPNPAETTTGSANSRPTPPLPPSPQPTPPLPPPPPPPTIGIHPPLPDNTGSDYLTEIQKQGEIILDVAFSSLQYIEVTQEPSMTVNTFISNIGGQIGLWIGASIITMIKFFVILSPVFCSFFQRRGGSANNQ